MPLGGRAGLLAGIAAIAIAIAAGSYYILRDDYQVLFSDLAERDAAAMIGELDRMKVPYRLENGGTSILVEREAVYKTRMKLMGKGVPLNGTVGLEIFNNADFGMTEFSQKVNYQRALQGELARTIMSFDEVKVARVHLVLPESGLLKKANTRAKASISLVMKGDRRLDPEQVSGIQRLVAASVPEIDPSAVTVVDHRGMAISKQVATDENGRTAPARLETKSQVEEYLTRKVLAVLDRAVGPGKAIVSIDATIDYDQVKVTKEDIVPPNNTLGQAVGAVARRRESQQGGDMHGDLSVAGGLTSRGVNGNAGAFSSETEYLNGRRVEQVVTAPGGIRRLSVGVLVPDVGDPAKLAKLREMVALAVGVNDARGDAIAVYAIDHPATQSTRGDPGAGNAIAATDAESTAASEVPAMQAPRRENTTNALWILLAFVLLAGAFAATRLRRTPAVANAAEPASRERLLADITRWAESQRT